MGLTFCTQQQKNFSYSWWLYIYLLKRNHYTCDYLDCISSADALKLDEFPTRHFANYSFFFFD